MSTNQTIESIARDSYARLLAYLAVRCRDIAIAEDSLGDALVAALENWPITGVPDNPAAWLLTTARRKVIDQTRREKVHFASTDALQTISELVEYPTETDVIEDERVKMLFVCAHPAIDASVRTPLMLQVVLEVDAARIGALFLVAPATMGQRLVRAKRKIRDAGIPFAVPDPNRLPLRLESVLEAIYAAYSAGWDEVAGGKFSRSGLADEAIRLARLVVDLLPDQPEARGLLSLMLHCEARRYARRSMRGEYIPLAEQDITLWSKDLIEEAEQQLNAAALQKTPGRFQFEAAIQSVHAHRAVTGETDWGEIVGLYDQLVQIAPAIGTFVGRAAAMSYAYDPASGLAALDSIDQQHITKHQPFWAVRAHILGCLGRKNEAHDAYAVAIRLCNDTSVREFLTRKRCLLNIDD